MKSANITDLRVDKLHELFLYLKQHSGVGAANGEGRLSQT